MLVRAKKGVFIEAHTCIGQICEPSPPPPPPHTELNYGGKIIRFNKSWGTAAATCMDMQMTRPALNCNLVRDWLKTLIARAAEIESEKATEEKNVS